MIDRRVSSLAEVHWGHAHEFVNNQDEASLKVPLPSTVKLRDPFLRAKKKMGWGGEAQ